jgi:hypothetical protein
MNFGRIAAAAVSAWIVSIVLGFLINGVLLANLIAANASAVRPEAELTSMLPLGFAGSLVGFCAFAYAYAKGYEGGSGLVEGARFGLLVAVLLIGFSVVWQYVVYPISGSFAVAGIVSSLITFPLYGAIVGAIYKPAARDSARAAAV